MAQVMSREMRVKLTNLETILARHNAAEKRTLADLHRAGWNFQTVAQAYKTFRAQRTMHMFTEEQIELAIRILDGTRSGTGTNNPKGTTK